MNKSMLMGLVAGIGVATAGGVLGYQFLGQQGAEVAVEERGPGRRGAGYAHGCSPGRKSAGTRKSPSRPTRRTSIESQAPRSAPSSAARSARTSATATSRRRPVRLPAP